MRAVLVALIVVTACGDNVRGNITVSVPEAWKPAVGELVTLTPYSGLKLGDDGDFQIQVVDDDAMPAEGYQIDPPSAAVSNIGDGKLVWRVHAHDVLGAQYGVTTALENMGFSFRHPFDPRVPWAPQDMPTLDNNVHKPQIRVRGLHLHTLHPIESYFAVWDPSAGGSIDAHRIIDWIIKNKGNYVQWAGLDNIQRDPMQYDAWKAFTRELIDYAHMRGVRIGLDIELFGKSNLQNAFDLHDTDNETLQASIAARLPLITQDLPFDVYDLSFGEFFNSEPQMFIDATNEVARQLRELAPAAEMHALVHVGATQRVTYMGRDMLYYFLVQYADPTIVPDIHSVMYFNLYEPTVGAYQHTDFSEHRQYLLDRICAGQKAAYHPETAYWVAFDNSLPMMIPLYIYSRYLDLRMLAQDGCGKPLDEHLIFSSGWEWGYWLHDVVALRTSYELPEDYTKTVDDVFAADMPAAGSYVSSLIALQHQSMIDDQLSGYFAGRDLAIDAGRMLDPPIISQPDRITYDQLATTDLTHFQATVLDPLTSHVEQMTSLVEQMQLNPLPDTRWGRELRDGFEVDLQRARFVLHTNEAVVAHLQGDEDTAKQRYDDAKADMATAHTIVQRRHRDLHDTHGRRLVEKTTNFTYYQYGYLYNADTMCYWNRELVQVSNILGYSTDIPPGCLF